MNYEQIDNQEFLDPTKLVAVHDRLETLLDQAQEWDKEKQDYTGPVSHFTFDETCKIVVPLNPLFNQWRSLELTDWALGQVCNKLGPPPLAYMRKCPPNLRSWNLNYWLQQLNGNGKGWMVRSFGKWARAVLSKDYTPIANSTVIEFTLNHLREGSGLHYELCRPRLTPDSLHLRLETHWTKDGNYSTGIFIGNGEIGNYQVKVIPFVKVTGCDNSIIVDDGYSYEQRHIWISLKELSLDLKREMSKAMHKAPEYIDMLIDAEQDTLPTLAEVAQTLCKKHNMSDTFYDNILIGSQGQRTRAGLIQGITFASHTTPGLDHDDQLRMDMLAGSILSRPGDLFDAVRNRQRQHVEIDRPFLVQ